MNKNDNQNIVGDELLTNNEIYTDTLETLLPLDSTIVETFPDKQEEVIPQEEIKSVQVPKPKTIRLEMGKTLRLIALDAYGHREFWVYIYLENKSKIVNPNKVPVGVELIIAPKEKYGIDADNPTSISKAIARGNEELSKFK